MDKKVKNYIDFIVKDLIKGTPIDVEGRRLKLPHVNHYNHIPRESNLTMQGAFDYATNDFNKYVGNKYGVKDESLIVWFYYTIELERLLIEKGIMWKYHEMKRIR